MRTGEAIAVNQACLLGKLVESPALLDQLGWCVEFRHPALFENDDSIRVDDRVDPVRDRNDRSILEDAAAQSALEQRIRLHVNRGLG